MRTNKTLLRIFSLCIVLGISTCLSAKCSLLFVDVQGEVHSHGKAQTIIVRVYPRGSKQFFEGSTHPANETFHVEVAFNTLKSVRIFGEHNCSNRPQKVVVTLMQGKIERQSIVLAIDKDFAWNDKTARWSLKIPLILGDATQSTTKLPL